MTPTVKTFSFEIKKTFEKLIIISNNVLGFLDVSFIRISR